MSNSPKQAPSAEQVRKSVQEGVEKIVKPFLERVRKQRVIPAHIRRKKIKINTTRIQNWDSFERDLLKQRKDRKARRAKAIQEMGNIVHSI